jgi:cytidylate kinase/CBS domain-containing protein
MPIISLSRGTHSGGTQLAERLRDRLDYRVVSQEIIVEASQRFGVTEDEILRGLDMPANFFERFARRKQRYVVAAQATLGELFADGNGIYHGLAGHFLFGELCNVLKVRIMAPMDYRIRQTMSALACSRDEAIKHIEQVDQRRAKWGRQMFGVDWDDASLYDLVINLGHVSLDEAADLIVESVRQERYRPTPKCAREFRSFCLEKRVYAELFFNSPFNPDLVQVRAEEGSVYLSGGSVFKSTQRQVVDLVGSLEGVEKVFVEEQGQARQVSFELGTGLSSRDAKARDVMIDASRYPVVTSVTTIRESIVALSASAVKLEDGYLLAPRYLLVTDADGNLAGIASRRELLRGLLPQLREAERSRANIRVIAGFGGDVPAEIAIQWQSLFSQTALDGARQPVGEVIAPVKGSVQADDSLSNVVSTMLHHGVDLVPVLESNKIVGLILMTDIFDLVAQFVMEHGGAAGQATGEDP